ncbi:MAG: VLRF1 family aeRF1-type release factor [Gemmatimonadota bacterium]
MISREQIQQLIEREADRAGVLSVFLDMSVNSNNKRTHHIFLAKEKAAFAELDSDREGHHNEAIGAAFARLERWLDSEYDESKKGIAFFTALDGDWQQGHQVSVPLPNRVQVSKRPIVSPLVEVVERYHHHGVVLVDREHLRLLSVFIDQTLNEKEVTTEPYPAAHDVQRGGFSSKNFQKRKEEETRHFFKEFGQEVEDFVRRYRPEDLILLGTTENVKKFREFLPDAIDRMVAHTDRMEIDATASEVRQKLAPLFEARIQEEEARAVDLLRDRVRESHLAVAGLDNTLEQLQGGKLQTLVIGRGLSQQGGRCEQCRFVLARTTGTCPYCGGNVRDSLDLGEELVRIAEDQSVHIDFVEPSTLGDLGGVGGLLRF